MSGYIPISREERAKMLESVGVSIDHLFDVIPESLRLDDKSIDGLLDEGMNEADIAKHVSDLAAMNKTVAEYDSFLGGGFYDHYQPLAVNHLINRQEFLTSYTPYQAEISQGTLQATFEWQTYLARLTGLDVANSSVYDGASAAAESLLLACRQTRKEKVWISAGVNPDYIKTVKTYFGTAGLEVEVGELNEDGHAEGTYPEGDDYAAFMIQSPNYYGLIENLEAAAEAAHKVKALAVASMDPIALTLFKTPGEAGIDIACGEAQSLGLPMSFGGPALGYMVATKKLMRKMPGRIAGQTTDSEGRRAFVLTLQAREQHIRREKATSNICTAQALLATAATMYMAFMGRDGMRQVAEQSAANAIYLQKALVDTGLFEPMYDQPFFREFAVKATKPIDLKALNKKLLDHKIIGGIVPEENVWLLAVTEKMSREAMDRFVEVVKELV